MRSVSAILLVLVVGASPFWLGSNRPLPWGANAVAVGLVLVMAGLCLMASRHHPLLRPGVIAVPALLVTIGLGWAVVQVLPIGILDHPAWQLASAALGDPVDGAISVNPTETWWAITRWVTAAGVFVAAYCLGRDRRLALIMLRGFLLLACVAAVYGLVRIAFSLDKILWLDVVARPMLTSGFVNQNSAATYFGMGSIAALALVMESARGVLRQGVSGRDRVRLAAERLGQGLGLQLVVFFTLFVALLITASRGGIFATLAGVLILFTLYLVKAGRQRSSGGAGWVAVIVLGLVLVAGVVELSGARLVARLMEQGLEADLRIATYVQTIAAVNDHLLMGSGLGTFQDIFPAYRLETGNWIWDKAHNDYLELMLELGLPAALIMLVALLLLVLRALGGFFARRRDEQFAAAAVAISMQVALHSAVDFSLQIQANTLAFALILGLGLAQSISSRASG
jgi:O-antigen ligase